jgi:hypothetical protein
MRGVYFHVPIDTAITPADGKCLADRWWAVHPDKGLLFYAVLHGYFRDDEPAPQCNSSEATMRLLTAKMTPDHEVRHMPIVFLKHAWREMNRLKKEPTP